MTRKMRGKFNIQSRRGYYGRLAAARRRGRRRSGRQPSKQVREATQRLMCHSLKTPCLTTFKASLDAYVSTSGTLFRHYHSSNMASSAFRVDQVRQSMLKAIVERTAPGALAAHCNPGQAVCTTVVFVGAAYGGGTPTWRHRRSRKYRGGPSCVKLLVRELAKFVRVVMTNEYQ